MGRKAQRGVNFMEDSMILSLYINRDETAITQTASKYGDYCTKIAMNILKNRLDTEECVNDTWLKAWNAIPPQKPAVFSTFLGRITRNLSLDVYNANKAKKRGDGGTALVIEELADCVSSGENVQDNLDFMETKQALNDFLRTLKEEPRVMFIKRYWHEESIGDIAKQMNMSVSKVKSMLLRTRNKLKLYLQERGTIV
jgi:RNA polymerase sigma-70 factor (ECF subfamily)